MPVNDQNYVRCPECNFRYGWRGAISAKPPCPKCGAGKKGKANQGSAGGGGTRASGRTSRGLAVSAPPVKEDVKRALEQCDEIIEGIEELPDRAYVEWEPHSVRETVEGIRKTISEREFVSEGQQEALNNIQSAVEAWLH
jgi:hypothetical protein